MTNFGILFCTRKRGKKGVTWLWLLWPLNPSILLPRERKAVVTPCLPFVCLLFFPQPISYFGDYMDYRMQRKHHGAIARSILNRAEIDSKRWLIRFASSPFRKFRPIMHISVCWACDVFLYINYQLMCTRPLPTPSIRYTSLYGSMDGWVPSVQVNELLNDLMTSLESCL